MRAAQIDRLYVTDKLKEGSPCECRQGTMTLEAVIPLRRRPGHSELYFRREACRKVVQQIRDDRFRDQ
jgi:hypothetical protein